MIQEFIEFCLKRYNIVAYIIALILGIKFYGKYFDTELKYFPMIIAYTLFNELLGYFVRNYDDFAFFPNNISANDVIYNIYDLVMYGYFYFVLYRLNKNVLHRRIIFYLAISVLISYAISAFFQNPLTMALFYATSYASVILVVCVILYFINRFTHGKWEWYREKFNLVTWVSFGLLIFYTIFPIIFLIGYLRFDLWEEYNLRTLQFILITVMYIMFCIGFVKSSRKAFQ